MTPHVYPRQCAFKSVEDIKDKKVTIMGLGLNGGGEAAVRFFLNKGAYVTVTDMKTQEACCREPGSNRHADCSAQDFKSWASTSSAIPASDIII